MIDQTKFQAELVETLSKLRDKYEATHDDLVKILGYALDNIKYPAAPTAPPEKPKLESIKPTPVK